MTEETFMETIELVHPLYLDVPMMTSFLAAIDDGIAFGSNVRLKQGSQQSKGIGKELDAGVPKFGLFSSVLSLSLRGKIENKNSSDENEEIELVRKHTEASLFMQLRSLLQEGQITVVKDVKDLAQVGHGSLVEVTGQILRSPASAALDNFFKILSMMGVDLTTEVPAENQKVPGKGSGQGQQQQRKDPLQQMQLAIENRNTEFVLRIMQRLRDDLTKSKIVDVVMQIPAGAVSVVISLSSEFLPVGTFENLLSGHFTVLGKVTRVLKEEGEINLYHRSTFASLLNEQMRTGIRGLQESFGTNQAAGTELIKAPAIQLIPLAIFV